MLPAFPAGHTAALGVGGSLQGQPTCHPSPPFPSTPGEVPLCTSHRVPPTESLPTHPATPRPSSEAPPQAGPAPLSPQPGSRPPLRCLRPSAIIGHRLRQGTFDCQPVAGKTKTSPSPRAGAGGHSRQADPRGSGEAPLAGKARCPKERAFLGSGGNGRSEGQDGTPALGLAPEGDDLGLRTPGGTPRDSQTRVPTAQASPVGSSSELCADRSWLLSPPCSASRHAPPPEHE